jgi:hypothetical protein
MENNVIKSKSLRRKHLRLQINRQFKAFFHLIAGL